MAPPAVRPFRFGVQTTTATDRAAWVALARRIEDRGYAVLTLPDHFHDQLAPVPALMAAADATERLRIGALVWDNDYRHPVVLAKELATLDLLSEGRLEIGLGAGWERVDYDRAGMTYDPPGVRIDRFVEGLDVIDALLGGEAPVSYSGTHYRITDLTGTPQPVQRPRPPVLIGAGGPRMLRIAAERADIVGINGTLSAGVIGSHALATMTAEAVEAKVAIARHAAAAAGRLEAIEWNIRTYIVQVTDDRAAAAEAVGGMIGFSAEEVLASPFALIGTPAQIADDLRERRERYGFSYVIVGAAEVDAFAPVVAELAGR